MKDIDIYVNSKPVICVMAQGKPQRRKKMLQYISVEYKESIMLYRGYSKSLATLPQIRGPN